MLVLTINKQYVREIERREREKVLKNTWNDII